MDSIEELLDPIPGDNPSGPNLRYSLEFDRIKEARREDPDLAQGIWKKERRLADYGQVTTLTWELLRSKTKDLQLAVWLTEAQTNLNGFEGLALGLQLIKELLQRFWESLHPELEDGDVEMRAAPLGWLGGRDMLVRTLALTDSGLTYLNFMDAQRAGREEDSTLNAMRREQFEIARSEGKTTLDDWDRSVSETRRWVFETRTAAINACVERLRELKGVSEEFFGEWAPDYRELASALDEVRVVCERALWQKAPELSHSTAEEADLREALEAAAVPAGPAAAAVAPAPAPPAEETARKRPTSRAEAINWILQGAAYLRGENPYSTTAYRLVRVLRWGELGVPGAPLDAATLTPPPTPLRQEIRTLAAGKEWGKLLTVVEDAMALEWGRGWLDLQRHAYRACEQLGDDYREVRLAIRAEVRSLLETYPDLMTTPLADDTPTANFETAAWLRESVLANGASEGPAKTAQGEEDAPEPVVKIMAKAAGHAAAGNFERAIDTLRPAIARQTSPRMRFRLKAHLGVYCLSAGHKAMARSVLQELADQIETLHLEDWEAPEELAAIYAGLYQCLEGADGHALTRETLYAHICRLDPAQAPPR